MVVLHPSCNQGGEKPSLISLVPTALGSESWAGQVCHISTQRCPVWAGSAPVGAAAEAQSELWAPRFQEPAWGHLRLVQLLPPLGR